VVTDVASVPTASVAATDLVVPPIEAASIISTPVSSDSGTASESASVQQRFAVSSADSGTASESASPRFSASGGTQTAFGADVASPGFLCSESDTSGSVTESATVLRRFSVADSGSATDSAQITLIGISGQDSGQGIDSGIVVIEPTTVGIPVDMEHALIAVGSSPDYAANLSANGLSRSTVLNVNGSTTLLNTRLGKATLRKVT